MTGRIDLATMASQYPPWKKKKKDKKRRRSTEDAVRYCCWTLEDATFHGARSRRAGIVIASRGAGHVPLSELLAGAALSGGWDPWGR